MPYKNVVIYFWSGTGNSYRVSTWMGRIAEENGLNTRVLSKELNFKNLFQDELIEIFNNDYF